MTDPQNPGAEPPAYQPPVTPPAAPPAYQTPAYDAPPAAPAYDPNGYQPAPTGTVPGRTLGIVALVFAIIAAPVGVILGIIALVQSKRAGAKNGLALAAIIVGAVLTVISIIVIVSIVAFFGGLVSEVLPQVEACLDDPSGTVILQGVEMTCEEVLRQAGR